MPVRELQHSDEGLRLLGRNCPEPAPARRSAAVQGSPTLVRTPACNARAALDGENAVTRCRNSKTAPLHPCHGLASGARRPSRAEVSGIKAEWPRLGTRRGAQPASPTAGRRRTLAHTEHTNLQLQVKKMEVTNSSAKDEQSSLEVSHKHKQHQDIDPL